MASIWEQVESALSGLGLPLAANVMIVESGQELPDRFLIYHLISSQPELHADDLEQMRSSRVQVTAYSRSGLADLPDIATAMVSNGFTRGPVRELPYSSESRHFALALDFWYFCEPLIEDEGD